MNSGPKRLVLVIGIVVDDAIVVVENVERLMNEEDMNARDATIRAMNELTGALVATSLVLAAVFVPVALLGGITGILYREFAVTITVAVLLSTVVALTLSPALCALLMRKDEGEQVDETFRNHFHMNLIHVKAQDRFLSALEGVMDPEEKRKIIGGMFIEVFDEEAHKLEGIEWLAQGTIYPDVIESAGSRTGKAHVIKSHHNVGGLPEDMELGLVEPLRELFKDEVRKIGLELGLPYDMLYRHPFPGPGLGVRVLGEVKKTYCDLLRRADAIFIEELHKADLYHKVSQAFTMFLPVRSVGVMGDGRKYDWVVSLRAVETIDFMTAHWAHLPYDFLGRVSNRIINEIDGISRVVYDISGKPPATIEWE